MFLSHRNIADLQHFLMDAASRCVIAGNAPREEVDELLSSAASLDYVLLVSSEHAGEAIPDDAGVAESVRAQIARAVAAALTYAERMLRAPDEAFNEFVERYVRVNRLFDVLRALRECGALSDDDSAFRILTLANDILERRRA
jgi:hypothetical protein